MEQKGPKASLGGVGPLDKIAIEHDLVKEALGQVLGLLIVVATAAKIVIDRFPVSLQEQPDQRPLRVLLLLDALDQELLGREKGLCRPAHVCLIA